jgi:membrane protease YdiL (CAAX protease family)
LDGVLSVKPWIPNAILRLFISVFVCIYAGSVTVVVFRFALVRHSGGLQFYLLSAAALVCLAATLLQLHRAWRLEEMMKRLAFTMGTFYAGLILGTWAHKLSGVALAPSVAQMFISALSFQGAAWVLVWCFIREHHLSWREAFGFGQQDGGAIWRGVAVACAFLPAAMLMQWASAKLMVHLPLVPLKPQEQEAVLTLQLANKFLDRVFLGFVTILLVPPVEEMLFRGILYPSIKQAGFPRLALWGTAVLFAAVHMNVVSFIPLMVFAMVLVALYEWTDNLLAAISAHACFNALNFFMLYLMQERLGHTP